MRTRQINSYRKNAASPFTESVTKSSAVGQFSPNPARPHSTTLRRVFDEYTSGLKEEWTFIGESEEWDLSTKHLSTV